MVSIIPLTVRSGVVVGVVLFDHVSDTWLGCVFADREAAKARTPRGPWNCVDNAHPLLLATAGEQGIGEEMLFCASCHCVELPPYDYDYAEHFTEEQLARVVQ